MYVAADMADWLDNEFKKSDERIYGPMEKARKKQIADFADANPKYFVVAVIWDTVDDINSGVDYVLSGRALNNASTSFVVDLGRLGSGFGEGTPGGIFQDVLRIVGIVPWGRVSEFIAVPLFRAAGPIVSRLKNLRWGALQGEVCVPISIAKAMEYTGTKLFITLEEAVLATGKNLSAIQIEGAGDAAIRRALTELNALFRELPAGEIRNFSEIFSLARNTDGVLLVALETKGINGIAQFHEVMVANTPKGVLIFDRYGIFSSFEELSVRYGKTLSGGFTFHTGSSVFQVKNWAMDPALVSKLNSLGPLGMVIVKEVQMVLGFNAEVGAEKVKEDFRKFVGDQQPASAAPLKTSEETPLKHTHRVAGPVVAKSDWLSSIAQKWYGDMLLWPILFDHNRDASFSNPNKIVVGQVINVPDISNKTAQELNDYRQRGRLWR